MPKSTNKKIALVRSSYSPFGGVELLTLDLIRELLENSIKVTLLTWPHQKWPIAHPDLQMVQLGSHRGNRLWQLWLFDLCVRKYLSDNLFDCVFSLDCVSLFTHLHAGGGTHKAFLEAKNESSTALQRIFRKTSLFHAYTIYLQKKGFSNPLLKKIHCCSKMVLNDIRQTYPFIGNNKLKVIYNGINWGEIGLAFQKRAIIAQELTRKYQFNSNWNSLLFLGSGFSRKGLDVAIDGLATLPGSYHLLIVGKGSPQPYMRQSSQLGLAHRLHFLGSQENGWKFASVCKALVLPSRYEPFGIAVAEAQAMGIPVLVSSKTGYSELVSEGKNGVIIETPMAKGNIHTAFAQLGELIQNPKMTPYQIRDNCKNLDNRLILHKLIRDFLDL